MTNKDKVEYTVGRKRANSVYTKGNTKYSPKKFFTKGVSSVVRLFISEGKDKVVVKKPKKLSDTNETKFLQEEYELFKFAYPNRDIHFFKTIEREARLVMPYFDGVNLLDAFKKYPKRTSEITLAVAKELQRIHDIGIIHNDIKDENIIIILDEENNSFIAQFIDFGCAKKKDSQEELQEIERKNDILLLLHTLEDITKNITFTLPSPITNFITNSLVNNIKERPSRLDDLITGLSPTQEAQENISVKELREIINKYKNEYRGFFRRYHLFARGTTHTVSQLEKLCKNKNDADLVNINEIIKILRKRDDTNCKTRTNTLHSTVEFFRGFEEKKENKNLTATEKVVHDIAEKMKYKIKAP